ncbi:MAG: hypothetical protein DIJKHBIC_02579 [Thermoanaerobaculia bacterium]|nr:hypothetical protein [Thermoanaerobaculia bacterium]
MIGLLFAAVVGRLILHAVYLPAFEGPDEPAHLARAVLFLDGGMIQGLLGLSISPEICGAVHAAPCCPALGWAYGCPDFAGRSATFNILRPPRWKPAANSQPNYESHQPPVYYMAGMILLKLAGALGCADAASNPFMQLLLMRLYSVFLVAASIAFPMRVATAEWSGYQKGLALFLLLVPGAPESLARCANDAGVFAFAAVAVWAVRRESGRPLLTALAALGPFIKLTCLPLSVLLVVKIWRKSDWRSALALGSFSLLFLPIQALRGYRWGGTVELNGLRAPLSGLFPEMAAGMLHSALTFIKTAFWLGEWSFFRPPHWLLAAALIGTICLVPAVKPVWPADRAGGHILAAGLALGSTTYWFLSHRAYWGTWGGVGGWYLWGWYPWLSFAVADFLVVRAGVRRTVAAIVVILVMAGNLAWFGAANRLYGRAARPLAVSPGPGPPRQSAWRLPPDRPQSLGEPAPPGRAEQEDQGEPW